PHLLQQASSPLPEYTKREEHINQQKSTWDDHRTFRKKSCLLNGRNDFE
ncbi:hypothetical protein scyTo_0023793, partial [Scyliorhinus torazame]|nr:hypothetical protein [Scyliorhinus torazame]